ncbi:MAG: segregation/condensation protein A [Desulfobacteraceae bacterium]|nr:segregation/condensation protein A [Desulfobacteraceae bacterium]
MSNPAYQVKLENIFEGPMDLLVHLIKKNEVDIYDIPIALITDQFLEYIKWMQDMEIDVATDFLVMASTLAQIKSRILLPADTDNEAEEDEDPRDAIAGPLAEYMRIKSAAQQLGNRNILNEHVFIRRSGAAGSASLRQDTPVEADLYELIGLYQDMIDRMVPEPGFEITPEKISVKEKMTEIIDLLKTQKTVSFRDLAAGCSERGEIIAAFLAVLEVIKLNLAGISQSENSSGLVLFSR